MNDLMGGMTGALGLLVIVFLLVLGLLWFLLPFAVFGTKDKLTEIIAQSRKTNVELAKISAELAAMRSELAPQGSSRSATET